MQTDLWSGIDRMTYYTCTIADTDANTYKLPPSFLLHYRPRLNSVLAIYDDAVYMCVPTAELNTQFNTAAVCRERVAVLLVLKRHSYVNSVRISNYQRIRDGSIDSPRLSGYPQCVVYAYCIVNYFGTHGWLCWLTVA